MAHKTRKLVGVILMLSLLVAALAAFNIPTVAAASGQWELVTDVNSLKAGDQIVIACNSKGFVASSTITSNYMKNETATFSGDKKTITNMPDGAAILTLGGSAGNWTFTNASGKLLGATAVKKVAWGSGTTTWTISISSNNATIQSTTSSYGRFLYNVSNPRFTTYTSATNTSMLLPQIYRFVEAGDGACTHANAETVAQKNATCTAEGYTEGKYCPDCEIFISGHQTIAALGHTGGTATCVAKAVCTREGCGVAYGNFAPHNYVNRVCSVCEEEMPNEATVSFATFDQRTEFSNDTQVWQNDGLVITNNKASSTTNIGNYCGPVRFYKSSQVVIAFPGMTSIVIETSGDNSDWNATLDNAGLTYEKTSSGYSITFDKPTDSITLTCQAQVRASSITVYAPKATACDHTYDNACDKDCNLCGETRETSHTHADAVIENVVNATCTEKGYYDSVVYCSVCNETLDREEVEVDALGHNMVAGEVVAPTFDADGYTVYTCTNAKCDATENRDFVDALVHPAQIGDVKYESLQEALNVGGEVKLLRDVTLEGALVISADKTVTLDLNGHTVVYNSTVQGEAMITNYGTLTINDSVGTGVIDYKYTGAADPSYGKGNYTISNRGTLTVNGGKITIADLSAHAKYPIDNNSTSSDAILVINGGHLYNYNTSAIRQFCNSTVYKNSVTINGGKIEGYSAIWVQNPGSKTVNGNLTITDGEIKSTAKAYVNGTASLADVGSGIYFTINGNGGAWSADSAMVITGGTFNENVELSTSAPVAMSVSDKATFKGRVELPTLVAEINGMKYQTLAAAFAAVKDGETIVLLCNVALDAFIDFYLPSTDGTVAGIPTRNVTLDLGGYTISSGDNYAKSWYGMIYVGINQTLNIKNGKITCHKNEVATVGGYGVINLENCTVENTFGAFALSVYVSNPGDENNDHAYPAGTHVGTGKIGDNVTLAGDVSAEGDLYIGDSKVEVAENFVKFKGAGIRVSNANGNESAHKISLRFGYEFADVDQVVAWGWSYSANGQTRTMEADRSKLANGENGKVSNLVLTGIPAAYLDQDFTVTLWYQIEVNGVIVTLYDEARVRNAEYVMTTLLDRNNQTETVNNYLKAALYAFNNATYADYKENYEAWIPADENNK